MCAQIRLQKVAEIQVLLISHISKAVLAMYLGTGLLKCSIHGMIDEVPGKTGCLAVVALLLLHPCDEDDLSNDYNPQDTPDDHDALERVHLHWISQARVNSGYRSGAYILRSKFSVEDVRRDNVTDRVCSIERGVVNSLLGLSRAITTHPGDEQRVDCIDESDQVVADKQTTFIRLRFGEGNQKCYSNDDDGDQGKQEGRLALESICEP